MKFKNILLILKSATEFKNYFIITGRKSQSYIIRIKIPRGKSLISEIVLIIIILESLLKLKIANIILKYFIITGEKNTKLRKLESKI